MLISQKNHCVVVTLSTGNTGIQSLKTVHELYSWTQKCSKQFKILCFQHSYKKTPPPLQSSSPKNLSENHIQDLQLYTEADLRKEGFALFCRPPFYLAAITQSANSTTGVINVQTPHLCRQAVNRCDVGEEHTKRALKISASFQQSAAVRGWRSGFENEKGGKEDNHKGGWVNTEGKMRDLWWRAPWLGFPKDCMVGGSCWRNRMCRYNIRSSNADILILPFQFLLSLLNNLPTHTQSAAAP